MYKTIFALPDSKYSNFRVLDDICFGISVKDKTFVYKTTMFRNKGKNGKLVLMVYSDDKNTAYKRGMSVSKYYYNKTGDKIFFKVIGDDND